MLQFRQSDTAAPLILTLNEMATLPAPNYLFVFTHVITKDVVSFTKLNSDDESTSKARYNQFTVNPSVLFLGKQPGEWHYTVFENDANGEVLENGKLLIDRATDFSFTKYETPTSFKTYNG